jgi:hypothetical protein
MALVHKEAALLKAQLNEPMTRVEFFRKVGALSHLFNDGHTFLLWPYQEYQALKERGALVFPFALDVIADGVFIKHDYEYDGNLLPKGSKLQSINGVDVNTIFSQAQQYVGGETDVLRQHVIAARFPIMLWAVFGYIDSFEVKLDINGGQKVVDVSAEDTWKQHDQATDGTNDDFVYRKLNDDTGYLKVATFDVSPDWFEDFIDETFDKVRLQKINTLVIDIRENGGGNTDTSTYLARYIASSPFRMISSMRERLNTDNRGLFNYRGNKGDTLEDEWDDWVDPIGEDRRFKGNTFVLISPLSYSSAIVFATAVKDNQIATLVGRETGGFANQTAQGNLFNLPNSELRVYVATRLLVRPNGKLEVSGVVPDIKVSATPEQIMAGIDADIQATLKHAKGATQ